MKPYEIECPECTIIIWVRNGKCDWHWHQDDPKTRICNQSGVRIFEEDERYKEKRDD